MWNDTDDRQLVINSYRSYNNLEDYLLRGLSLEYKNLKKIFVSDCDGIISTNESFYSKDGKVMKSYGCYDKEMIKLMKSIGWEFIFVTADKVGYPITKARIDDIDCTLVIANSEERADLVKRLKEVNDYVIFIGDSISDIPALAEADLAGTTMMAPKEVQDFCDYISEKNGGYGGFADIVNSIHNQLDYRHSL